jgi:acyl-CoA hydrolase
MVAINTVREIDFTGQVSAGALPFNKFSGVNGSLDFFRDQLFEEAKAVSEDTMIFRFSYPIQIRQRSTRSI